MDEMVLGGRYRVVRELDADLTRKTYLAADDSGAEVIVRIARPENAEDAASMEKAVSEISGIVSETLPRIHEWGNDGSDFFVLRDFVPGADLATELGLQGRFAPIAVARIGETAAGALEELHARGLVHGSVSTASLVKTPEDTIKLVGHEFGPRPAAMPESADAALTAARYLAPEQIEGGGATPATDVYSLGVVLYELAAGRAPFDGPTAAAITDQHVHAAPAPLRQVAPDVPMELERVIMRALEKVPGERFPSAAAMHAALATVVSPAPLGPPAEIEYPPDRTARWVWAVAIVLLALVVAGLAWAFAGAGKTPVPDLNAMTLVRATSAVNAAGLRLGSVSFSGASSPGVSDGSVSAQYPAAGTDVSKGTSVDLVLAGQETVDVPNLLGLAEAQATTALSQAGFAVGGVSRISTSTAVEGTVIGQEPAAGAKAPKGSQVTLRIAEAGPATVPLPDVSGNTRDAASTMLRNAGFTVSVVTQASTSVSSGFVISQSPQGGASTQVGSVVTIVVSSGPPNSTVPDVKGDTQVTAVNALTSAGFRSQIATQTGGGTVGTVVKQRPTGGTKAAPGSTVVITVAQ